MSNVFTEVQKPRVPRSTFNCTHNHRFDAKAGLLQPSLVMEAIPGGEYRITSAQFTRMAPLVVPMMHQVKFYEHIWFVPYRLLDERWEDFVTGGEDGSQNPVAPKLNVTIQPQTLLDYMGLPTTLPDGNPSLVSAYPVSAYNFIYNENYRDQNLIPALDYKLSPGDDNEDIYQENPHPSNNGYAGTGIQYRAWGHDYLTSALPWTQKGPEATIPLGTEAEIQYRTTDNGNTAGMFWRDQNGTVQTGAGQQIETAAGGVFTLEGVTAGGIDMTQNHFVDLSSATAATINDLRSAFKLQEWLEKNARYGTRYTEYIWAHYKTRTGDARLDRPEFLGGMSDYLTISEVLQTSGTNQSGNTTPQGNMAGHGISVGEGRSIHYKAKEFGLIIGIISIMPKTSYQDGVPKLWRKFDRFDYAVPEFGNLGEQPIYNWEVYEDPRQSENDEIFGYIPRYSEYKYHNDQVSGTLRGTLDFWHWGRKFSSRPNLNREFIECKPDTRVFANLIGEQFYVTMTHDVKVSLPLPYYGTPKSL